MGGVYSSLELEATNVTDGHERKLEDVRDCIDLALCYMAQVEGLHVPRAIVDSQLAEGVGLFDRVALSHVKKRRGLGIIGDLGDELGVVLQRY